MSTNVLEGDQEDNEGNWKVCILQEKESDAFKNYYPAKLIDESTLNGIYRESSPYVVETAITSGLIR